MHQGTDFRECVSLWQPHFNAPFPTSYTPAVAPTISSSVAPAPTAAAAAPSLSLDSSSAPTSSSAVKDELQECDELYAARHW